MVGLVIRLFLRFFCFHIGVHLACFGPSLNNPLAQKDAPGRTRHRFQFIASKTSMRLSYGRVIRLLLRFF